MRHHKKGFTLIEVALFLVITGALFAAVTIGVQNTIQQQKINDSVQSFAEFLRNVYSETTNVQNISAGGGRSEDAIYGKLVTFGEDKSNSNLIYTYDVIGHIGDIGNSDVLNTLNSLNANVAIVQGDSISPVGIVESYLPKWASSVEKPCDKDTCEYEPFVGALLIVRHPSSGIVYTYSMAGTTIEVNQRLSQVRNAYDIAKAALESADTPEAQAAAQADLESITQGKKENILSQFLVPASNDAPHFEMQELNFCINSTAGEANTMRRNVRILKGSRNASGIEIVSDDISKCAIRE